MNTISSSTSTFQVTENNESQFTFFKDLNLVARSLEHIENDIYQQQLNDVFETLENEENIVEAISGFINDTRNEFEKTSFTASSNSQVDVRNNCHHIVETFLHQIKDSVWARKERLFSFEQITQEEKLKNIINGLIQKRNNCDDSRHKLHFTFIISKIVDKIIDINYRYKFLISKLDRLNYILQPGDLILIKDKTTWTDNEQIIGMIGDGDARSGYKLTFSALDKGEVKANQSLSSLNDYLNRLISCSLYVFRHRKTEEKLVDQLTHNRLLHESRHTVFAVAKTVDPTIAEPNWLRQDLDWTGLTSDCMQSLVAGSGEAEWNSALPGSYTENRVLEQVYIMEK